MVKINGNTKLCGLIGWPLEHTLSPAMHNAAFNNKKINAVYFPFPLPEKLLGNFLSLVRQGNFLGINVTIPYKEAVLKYLDILSPEARKIGAVNTIVVRNKKLLGYNTDAFGFQQASKLAGINVRGKKVLLIGAGGAASAIIWVLVKEKVRKIFLTDKILNRALYLRKKYPNICSVLNNSSFSDVIQEIDGVINATPVGMKKNDPLPIKLNSVGRKIFLYDVVYNRQTEFIRYGQQMGWPATGGLSMLLHQGIKAFELWTGTKAPKELMRKILEKEIKQNER